jgi:hypothetical protein
LEELRADGRIILKWILKRMGERGVDMAQDRDN